MKFMLSISLTFVLLFSACYSASRMATTSADRDSSAMPAATTTSVAGGNDGFTAGLKPELAQVAVARQGQAGQAQQAQQPSGAPAPATTDRKIIQNGDLTLESKNPTEDQRKIEAIAAAHGGFVVTSEFQQNSSARSTVNVIVRVPSAQFQAAIDKILVVGNQVLHKKLAGKDVTEEYVDLEAQLRAKKALEAQFLEIMKQARKVEDALSVQEKLSEVRTEIERLEGRRRYLENQAAFSTINITLQTPAPLTVASQTGFWASIKESFGDGVDVAVAIVLGLIRFVIVMFPVVVLLLLPGGWLLRYCWRRFGWGRVFKKEAVSPQAEV